MDAFKYVATAFSTAFIGWKGYRRAGFPLLCQRVHMSSKGLLWIKRFRHQDVRHLIAQLFVQFYGGVIGTKDMQ